MLQVVLLETHGHGQANGQIAKVPKVTVGGRTRVSECLIVGDLVHPEGQGVVNHSTDTVGHDKDDRPGLVLHDEQHDELQGDHEGDDPLEVGIVSEELLDLRVLFQDHLTATGVRLFRVGPLKVRPGHVLTHDERVVGSETGVESRIRFEFCFCKVVNLIRVT